MKNDLDMLNLLKNKYLEKYLGGIEKYLQSLMKLKKMM